MWSFFTILCHSAAILLILFTALSYATGLFYLAELAEEYPTKTKKVLRISIVAILLLHIILAFTTTLSYLPIILGFATHICYWLLSSTYPDIQLKSLPFIGSCIGVIASQGLWYYEFRLSSTAIQQTSNFFNGSRRYEPNSRYNQPYPLYTFSTVEVISFTLLLVWFVPLFYFISGNLGDSSLPTTLTAVNTTDSNAKSKNSKKSRFDINYRSWFKRTTAQVLPSANNSDEMIEHGGGMNQSFGGGGMSHSASFSSSSSSSQQQWHQPAATPMIPQPLSRQPSSGYSNPMQYSTSNLPSRQVSGDDYNASPYKNGSNAPYAPPEAGSSTPLYQRRPAPAAYNTPGGGTPNRLSQRYPVNTDMSHKNA